MVGKACRNKAIQMKPYVTCLRACMKLHYIWSPEARIVSVTSA